MRVDYSMFEGIKVKGMPKTVLSRGRPVIENGKFVGKAGSGRICAPAARTREFEICSGEAATIATGSPTLKFWLRAGIVECRVSLPVLDDVAHHFSRRPFRAASSAGI